MTGAGLPHFSQRIGAIGKNCGDRKTCSVIAMTHKLSGFRHAFDCDKPITVFTVIDLHGFFVRA